MRPKIIGILSVWAAEDWVGLCIKQALKYCDEVIVCVAGYTQEIQKFEDSTLDICKTFGSAIKIVEFNGIGKYVVTTRGKVLTKMLQSSDYRSPGNWVWLLDVDEFFSNACVANIYNAIESERFNRICINERFFYINMKHYLRAFHYRLFKIASKNDHFRGNQAWTAPKDKTHIVKFSEGMFHYSMLTNTNVHKCRWVTEYKHTKQSEKIRWLNDIYNKFELQNQDKWIKDNLRFFGVKSPWMNDGFKPDKNGRLFFYDGPHPDVIEGSGLVEIDDFRELYR